MPGSEYFSLWNVYGWRDKGLSEGEGDFDMISTFLKTKKHPIISDTPKKRKRILTTRLHRFSQGHNNRDLILEYSNIRKS